MSCHVHQSHVFYFGNSGNNVAAKKPSAIKKSVALLPLLLRLHLSSKPGTSALKQVLGGCYGYKVTQWVWPAIEGSHSPSLARWKRTCPNCQSRAFMTSKPGRIHGSSETFVRWQMCCIPQALLTFTICLTDLSNKERKGFVWKVAFFSSHSRAWAHIPITETRDKSPLI